MKKRNKRKPAPITLTLLSAAVIMIIIAVTSETLSYFSMKDSVVNTLPMESLDFTIEEPHWKEPLDPVKLGDMLDKDPYVQNTGALPFVTRMKITEKWTLKDTTTVMVNPGYVLYSTDYVSGSNNFAAATWTTSDQLILVGSPWLKGRAWDALNGNYYYNEVVQVGGQTQTLFTAIRVKNSDELQAMGVAADEVARLTGATLEVIVTADAVEASPAAWKSKWGNDVPDGFDPMKGGI